MLAICFVDKPVVFKAPKPFSNAERVPQGTNLGAKPGNKKHSTSSRQTSMPAKRQQKLSSGTLAFHLNKHIYSASFTIHFESASGNDALAVSIAEADPGISAPSNFIPQQQGINEGTKNNSYDHLFTGKGASLIARQIKEETSSTIKLKDLTKLVSHVQPSFKELDSPKDNPVIIVDDSDEDEENKVHATKNSQKHKVELEKNIAKAEAAFLRAQPSFPNVGQLNELLVKSLQTEFSKILSAHDFSSSLPTELKDLPSKFNELTEESLQRLSQVAELKTLQWELLTEFVSLPVQVASVQAKLKILDALPCLLLSVTNALNMFAQVLDSDSSKDKDQSVPSKIEEEAKAEAARREGEMRKEELIDLLGHEVDPLDRLNDLANKKRRHADDIHDFFKANKRLKLVNMYLDIQGSASSSTIYMMDYPSMPFFNLKVLHAIPPSTLPQGSTSGIRACALRNFNLEVMEFKFAQNNTTAKLPILKLGEYKMWVIKDYALWEVIENGNSWVSVPQTTHDYDVSVTKMSVHATAKKKINKKNDVKARSLLLMALPNEHQLTFS
nr:hypothetical protein [Tanacetum cinerariifolium]